MCNAQLPITVLHICKQVHGIVKIPLIRVVACVRYPRTNDHLLPRNITNCLIVWVICGWWQCNRLLVWQFVVQLWYPSLELYHIHLISLLSDKKIKKKHCGWHRYITGYKRTGKKIWLGWLSLATKEMKSKSGWTSKRYHSNPYICSCLYACHSIKEIVSQQPAASPTYRPLHFRKPLGFEWLEL